MDDNNVIQFPLWPDELPPELQLLTDEDQEDKQEPSNPEEPWATQMYLPGFGPK